MLFPTCAETADERWVEKRAERSQNSTETQIQTTHEILAAF